MPSKTYPYDVVDQGRAVLEAWRSISPDFHVGELAPEALESDLNQMLLTLAQISRLEAERADARNQRDAISQAIWDKVKRLRRGVQAIYGDDSSQYDVVGGTRVSDRKPATRKVAVA